MAYSIVNIAPIADFGGPLNMITLTDSVMELLPGREIKQENKRRKLDGKAYKLVPFKAGGTTSVYFPDGVIIRATWAGFSAVNAELMRGWIHDQNQLLIWDREKLICYLAAMQWNPNPWTLNKIERSKLFVFELDIFNAVYYGDDTYFNVTPPPGGVYSFEHDNFLPGWP